VTSTIAALLLACCLAVPAEVTVESDKLTLGNIIPFPEGDPRASIALGFAPAPGIARRFLKPELLAKITTVGLKTDDLQLPESVLVRRKAQTLDAELIKAAVQDAFSRQFPNAAVNVLSVDVPQTPVTGGSLEAIATVPARVDFTAPVFVRVDVKGAGFSRSLFVRTLAEVQQPQLVLKNPIAANAPIRRDDVEWLVMPVRAGTSLSSVEKLEGVVASRDLKPGQVLTAELFYAPLLVRRGESVTVRATSGGITIAATMRAKADARFGDTISVEHLSGPGNTSARVIGPRTLETLGVK
jgi:flagella basal body P-ring formation protein FlgA